MQARLQQLHMMEIMMCVCLPLQIAHQNGAAALEAKGLKNPFICSRAASLDSPKFFGSI